MEFLTKLLGVIIRIGIGLLINAGIVEVIIWSLHKIGIYTIFGWKFAFSWPLVILFTVIVLILKKH